jgi:uncharacterized protein YecE (DUF72 family)
MFYHTPMGDDVSNFLQEWHQQISEHEGEITAVYSFFNNDYAGYSPLRYENSSATFPAPTPAASTSNTGSSTKF